MTTGNYCPVCNERVLGVEAHVRVYHSVDKLSEAQAHLYRHLVELSNGTHNTPEEEAMYDALLDLHHKFADALGKPRLFS